MRIFLGVLVAILGIAAIGTTLLGFGSQTLFWQAAHIIAGLVMVVGGVSLVRSEQTDTVDLIANNDRTNHTDYTDFTPPRT